MTLLKNFFSLFLSFFKILQIWWANFEKFKILLFPFFPDWQINRIYPFFSEWKLKRKNEQFFEKKNLNPLTFLPKSWGNNFFQEVKKADFKVFLQIFLSVCDYQFSYFGDEISGRIILNKILKNIIQVLFIPLDQWDWKLS